MKRVLAIIAIIFCFLPAVTFALGFGEVKLYSYLDEPLDAEVELLGAENYDTGRILVSLASAQEFKRAGLARPFVLSQLHFEISRTAKNTHIRITSHDPIRQPYLEFLIDLAWPGGRLVRGYTLLLDPSPPGIAPLHERRSHLKVEPRLEPRLTKETALAQAGGTPVSNTHQQRFEKLFDEKALDINVESPPASMTVVSTVSGNDLTLNPAEPLNEAAISKLSEMSFSEARENTKAGALAMQSQAQTPLSQQRSSSQVESKSSKAKETEGSKSKISISLDKTQLLLIASGLTILLLCAILIVIVASRRQKYQENFSSRMPVFETSPLNAFPISPSFDEIKFSPMVTNEITLKLELARNYLELGDSESALPLLKEVILLGSETEKHIAEQIYFQIEPHLS